MIAGGIKSPAILDELESHLREDVDRELRSGPDVERAFTAAVRKIGPASALKTEFKKSTAAVAGEKWMMGAAALVLVFGAFLSVAALLLCYSTIAERLMGFVAISLIFGTICGWPAFISRLPVIHPKRKLQAVQVACLLAESALISATFYYPSDCAPRPDRRAHYTDVLLGFGSCNRVFWNLSNSSRIGSGGRT